MKKITMIMVVGEGRRRLHGSGRRLRGFDIDRWRLPSHHHYHRVHFLHCRRLTRTTILSSVGASLRSCACCIKLSRDIFLFASKCLLQICDMLLVLRFKLLSCFNLLLLFFAERASSNFARLHQVLFFHFLRSLRKTVGLSDCASLCATRASNCACFVSAPRSTSAMRSASRCSCKEIFNSAMSRLVFGFCFFFFYCCCCCFFVVVGLLLLK